MWYLHQPPAPHSHKDESLVATDSGRASREIVLYICLIAVQVVANLHPKISVVGPPNIKIVAAARADNQSPPSPLLMFS